MKSLNRERQMARAQSKQAARGCRDGNAGKFKPSKLMSYEERKAYHSAWKTAFGKTKLGKQALANQE